MWGLTRISIWKEFAREANGVFTEGQYWHSDSVTFNLKSGPIIFDNYIIYGMAGNISVQSEYTRIRAPFKSNDELQFKLYRKGILSVFGKLFGAQDILIGDPEFDNAFIIKGNDELKIKSLLSGTKLKYLIAEQEQINLEIVDCEGYYGDKLPEGNYEMFFMVKGLIEDIEQLKSLKKLFEELMNELVKKGLAKRNC